jgi:hypothetical protein
VVVWRAWCGFGAKKMLKGKDKRGKDNFLGFLKNKSGKGEKDF